MNYFESMRSSPTFVVCTTCLLLLSYFVFYYRYGYNSSRGSYPIADSVSRHGIFRIFETNSSVPLLSVESRDPYYENVPSFVHKTSIEWIHQDNLSYPWLTLLATEDRMSHHFQHKLYKHQHPNNCTEVRVLLETPNSFGLGSDLHTITIVLAYAIETGRILAFEGEWVWTNQSSTCNSPYCYFAEITSCGKEVYKASDI